MNNIFLDRCIGVFHRFNLDLKNHILQKNLRSVQSYNRIST